MMRLFAVARNAFTETIRQPIFGVLVLVTFLVLALDLPLSSWTMGVPSGGEYQKTDQQLLISLGLSTLLVSGLFIAAFSAGSVLAREIEDRTILTVISKPVPRPTVVAGKYLGVAGALVVAFYLCTLVFLMTVRHQVMSTVSDPYDVPVILLGGGAFVLAILAGLFCNYFFGWPFASAAIAFGVILMSLAMGIIGFVGKGWVLVPFGTEIPPDVLPAMLLMLLGVLIFAAVAVAASTRFGHVLTLLICVGFFIIGSMSQYLFGRFADMNMAARLALVVMPNLTYFYALDALTTGKSIPVAYVGMTALYAACYIAAILAIGMAMFQRRELEAQQGASTAPQLVSLLAWIGRAAAVAAGILALILPSALPLPTHLALLYAAGLGLAAVVLWLFWGWFGRGLKWTWFVVLLAVLAKGGLYVEEIIRHGALLGLPGPLALAGLIGAALVLIILMLPKTRHHFGLFSKTRKSRFSIAG